MRRVTIWLLVASWVALAFCCAYLANDNRSLRTERDAYRFVATQTATQLRDCRARPANPTNLRLDLGADWEPVSLSGLCPTPGSYTDPNSAAYDTEGCP